MADIVDGDDVVFDRKQDAEDAGAAAIKHLAERGAKLLGFILGDRMPFRQRAQLGNNLVETRIPTGGGVR